MNYVAPLEATLSETYDDVEYSINYYKIPTNTTNISDEAYSNWNVVTTYSIGDYVIVPALKKIYRATTAHAGSYPPANPDKWTDYGIVNSYAMFASDKNIGSSTTSTDATIELDFSLADTLAFVDIDFTSMNIILFDSENISYQGAYNAGTTYNTDDAVLYNSLLYVSLIDSNTGNQPDISASEWTLRNDLTYYNENIVGSDFGVLDFGDYFYKDAEPLNRFVVEELEWLPNSILVIELSGASSIGTLAYGSAESLGVTIKGTSLKHESTSKFQTNEFTGFRDVIRYGKIRVLDVNVIFDTADFNIISKKVSSIMDKNVIWIPSSLDRFTDLITIGYIENFTIPLDAMDKINTKSKIIGVSR